MPQTEIMEKVKNWQILHGIEDRLDLFIMKRVLTKVTPGFSMPYWGHFRP